MERRTPGHVSLERWTIRLAPAIGMAAIAASVLFGTDAEPHWAQLFAGPTDHAGRLAWRVAAKRGSLERQLPLVTTVNIVVTFTDKSHFQRDIALDDDGLGWLMLDRQSGALHEPIAVQVREGSQQLAHGSVYVSQQQWQAAERLEGGWLQGHREGPRDIRVGVVDGVVLHSRPSEVVVSITEGGHAVINQPFSVSADGAEVLKAGRLARVDHPDREPLAPVVLRTDERGLGRLTVRTTDLAATLRVASDSPAESLFVGALPVRGGGIEVAREDHSLVVTSPVGLTHATVGLLTQTGLVDVRTVPLTASSSGSVARVTYDAWPPEPLWAMVSSEPQLDAGNTLGWPLLAPQERSEAHVSRVVPNRLVLDGFRAVTARLERQHTRAWATSSVALLLVGALLVFAIVRSNRRNQRRMASLDRMLNDENATSVAERAPYALIAVVVITAATVALTWWLSLSR